MWSFIVLLTTLGLLQFTYADVYITSPKSGATFSGSSGTASVTISWKDDDGDSDFSIDNVESYTISLCTGPYSPKIYCVQTPLAKAQTLSDHTFTASIDAASYPSGYYYVQIYAVFKDSSTSIHYSPRFQLTDMTGTSTLSVSVTGAVPGPETSAANSESVSYNSASFTVPYTLQTGKWRFAPMQTQPGTTVTATTWSRKFPTSAVTYYTSNSPPPSIVTTLTPGWNYTIDSAVNWATIAPYPTYFYPASSRVSKAQLKTAHKRRWLD